MSIQDLQVVFKEWKEMFKKHDPGEDRDDLGWTTLEHQV